MLDDGVEVVQSIIVVAPCVNVGAEAAASGEGMNAACCSRVRLQGSFMTVGRVGRP